MPGTTRQVYWGLVWLLIVSVLLQVFLAGLALFAGVSFELHRVYGGTAVHLISLVLVLLAWRARAGRRMVWLNVLLFAVVTLQVTLPSLRSVLPLAAAIHPMNALLIFWLAIHLARRADELRRAPVPPPAGIEPAPIVAPAGGPPSA